MPELLVIRADNSAAIGAGHTMRCLALAQEWLRTGGKVIFAQADSTPEVGRRLCNAGIDIVRIEAVRGSLEDAAQTADLARERGATIVADGYCFGSAWQRKIKDSGLGLLLWDDYGHAERYYADFILNQNLHASPQLYERREPYTRLLLGTRYAHLRREFLDWRGPRRNIPAVARKVLVTLGGSDPGNVTAKVMHSLARLSDVDALIVIGGGNRNVAALQSIADSGRAFPVRLLVDAQNMPELMAWADVAVSAGGSTAWELAFMGLPSIAIALNQEQANGAAALGREGVAVNLGEDSRLDVGQLSAALESLLNDSPLRAQMSERGRRLVDGKGAGRVITRLHAARLTLRPAAAQDCRLIWEWANDAGVRAVSFSPDPILWESHENWYSAKLCDQNCLFYVGIGPDGNLIGQIRFDVKGSEAVVSLGLTPHFRGKGLGPSLIVRGFEQFFTQSNAHTVHAYIKADNQRSIKAFEKAGFKDAGPTEVYGAPAWHFVLHRDTA